MLAGSDVFELRRNSPTIDLKVADYVASITEHKPAMLLGVDGTPVHEVEKVRARLVAQWCTVYALRGHLHGVDCLV